jgi:shikimate dehydrogenase
MLNGETKLMGLIGENISFSLSPHIHNYAATQLSVNIAYLAFNLKHENLAPFLDLMWEIGALGFNVTMPHKEAVAKLIDSDKLNSINTIYRSEKGWQAASTDGIGFERSLHVVGYDGLDDFENIIIMGNGGAAFALLSHLQERSSSLSKLKNICLLRRNSSKDAAFIKICNQFDIGPVILDFEPRTLECIDFGTATTLFIQASSAPQRGDDLARFAEVLPHFTGAYVDLTYGKPLPLLKKAKALGIPAMDGRPMLIEQARASQEIWWGKTISYEEIRDSFTNASFGP